MAAPKNNKHAAKPDGEKTDAQIGIRCRGEDKTRWINQASAQGKTLSEWIVETLNQAS